MLPNANNELNELNKLIKLQLDENHPQINIHIYKGQLQFHQLRYCRINQKIIYIFFYRLGTLIQSFILMNDFKVTLTKKHQLYLSRKLPKGYSFELFKVRKNISDYPFRQFEKRSKKNQQIVMSKRESVMGQIQRSQQSFRERSEQTLRGQPLKNIQEDCLGILRKLRRHQSSYPFRAYANHKVLQTTDYLEVVLEPTDLKTIEQVIRKDLYEHFSQFQRDIYKMIMNSYKYNQKTSSTYTKTVQFQEYFIVIVKQLHTLNNSNQNNGKAKQNVKQQLISSHKLFFQEKNRQILQTSLKNSSTGTNPFVHEGKGKMNIPKLMRQAQIVQRPRYSHKKLPEKVSPPHISLKLLQYRQQQQIGKQQQPQERQPSIMTFSQPFQPTAISKEQSYQMKDQLKSQLWNETQNNRDNNFSQGYNEFASTKSIPNVEVQKQISYLLKRLSEFPLTKHKKNKIISKFNNLQQNMTQTDKKKLYNKIFKLDQNDIYYIIRLLTKGKIEYLRSNEFQIDLDKADSKVLREIQNFIILRESSNNVEAVRLGENGSVVGVIQKINQVIKVKKKVKKREKKLIKKKMSRKNSNDDSFTINFPSQKRKKLQKHDKKKQYQQQSQYIDPQQISNYQQKSQSSYHPEPIHYHSASQSRGGHNMAQILPEPQIQPAVEQQKPSPQAVQSLPYHIPFAQQNTLYIQPTYNPNNFYDIDQYLVSSKDYYTYNHHNEQSVPLSTRSPGKIRNQNMYQLDLIENEQFHFRQNANPNYPDEEIMEYNMEDHKQDNDEDQFF